MPSTNRLPSISTTVDHASVTRRCCAYAARWSVLLTSSSGREDCWTLRGTLLPSSSPRLTSKLKPCFILQKSDYMGRIRVGKHLNGNILASNRDRPFSLKHCAVRCILVDSMTIVLDIEYTLSLRLRAPSLYCQPVDFLFVFFLPLYRARRFRCVHAWLTAP